MPHHIVLMGASNLAMAFPAVIADLVERSAGEPLVIYAARACGRSYGTAAGMAGFTTPGLKDCGLLQRLEENLRREPPRSCSALLTDVGNDIPYGQAPATIAGWVDGIVEHLTRLSARIAVTSLPVESVGRMPHWKFRMLRPLFFPFRPLEHSTVSGHLREVQETLEEIGNQRPLSVLETRPEWYSFDHFHLRRALRGATFSRWLDSVVPWPRPDQLDRMRLSASRLRLRLCLPAAYRRFGMSRSQPQGDGLAVAPNTRLLCF